MGDSPDTSGQNEAALMQANLSKEQLAWAKEIYAANAPAREAAAQRANELSDLQMEYTRTAMAQAQEGSDRYNKLFAPVEDSLVADAKDWASDGRKESEAGKAITDVRTQFNAAQAQQDANLKSMGVNPSDGRYGQMAQQSTTQQALAEATAANQARERSSGLWQASCPDESWAALPVFFAPGMVIATRRPGETSWQKIIAKRTCADPRLQVLLPQGQSEIQIQFPDWARMVAAGFASQGFDFRRDCSALAR